MENRFGLKDLAQIILMVAILVSIWVGMFQYDRQWNEIQQLQKKVDEQTSDLARMKRKLDTGVMVAGGGGGMGGVVDGELPVEWRGFQRAYEASLMEDYAEGDWLINLFGSKVPTLTPLVSSDAYADEVQREVMQPLVTRDPVTLEWLPLLAESWTTSDDGLVYTFKIREGIVCSDGEPFDAYDVQFTFDFLMNPEINAPRQRAYFERISSVEATSATEVVFKYDEPYFEAFDIIAVLRMMPDHYYGKYLEKPEDFNKSTGLLFGTGPYRLSNPNWTPDQPIELVRNERFWGPVVPQFDRILFSVVENDAARLQEFKNGDVDVFPARPLHYVSLLPDREVRQRTANYEYYNPRGGYRYIAWAQERDGKKTRFADKRVRQAMTYLTDRQRICDEIYLGYARPANGPFNPIGEQCNPDLPTRQYDLEKAIALLREAGYEDRDGDDVIEGPDGEPFRFKLVYPASNDDYKRMTLLLKDQYVRAGIVLEPEPTDWPILIKHLDEKTFDAITLGWTADFEIDIYQMFHSDQAIAGGDNFMSYRSERLDKLIDQARADMNPETRMPLWHQCHEVIVDEQPYTFLAWGKSLVFVDKRFKNVQTVKAGLNAGGLWGMPKEWYVPLGEQVFTD